MQQRKDPRVEAERYFSEKNVGGIVKELMTSLLLKRPEDPREFLKGEVRRLKQEAQGGAKAAFFTEQDKETVFQMFLPEGQDRLSPELCRKALETVGQGDQVVSQALSKEEFVALMRSS